MGIRILDPQWKKIYPDPGHDEPFRTEEIFIISLFTKVQISVSGLKKVFWKFLFDFNPSPLLTDE